MQEELGRAKQPAIVINQIPNVKYDIWLTAKIIIQLG